MTDRSIMELGMAVRNLHDALADFEIHSEYARRFLSPSMLFTTASTEALEELNLKSTGMAKALQDLQIALDTIGEDR